MKISYNRNISVKISVLIGIIVTGAALIYFTFIKHPYQPDIIVEKNSIASIFSFIKPNEYNPSTCVIFDIDNTLIKPEGHLGSDQWFRWSVEQFENKGFTQQQAVDAVLPRLQQFMNHLWMVPVEPDTVEVVKDLQDRGVMVIALTARSLDLTYRTIEHLDNAGITFSGKGPRYCPITYGKGKPALYIDGILFSGNYKKGEVIAHWFDQINYHPKKVIFVDDRMKNVESVYNAIKKYSYPIIGIRYGYLDEFIKTLTPEILAQEYAAFIKNFPESRPVTLMPAY